MVRVSVGGLDGNCHKLTLFNSVILKIIERLQAGGAYSKRKLLAAPALHFVMDKGDVYSTEKLD